MKQYRLDKLGSLDALKQVVAETPKPGLREVLVRMRAASLNHRDLNIITGGYTSHALLPDVIPLSDGAGEVASVGAGVKRWKAGDRVAPIFVQRWIGGDLQLEYMPSALGGPDQGVLSEYIVSRDRKSTRLNSSH